MYLYKINQNSKSMKLYLKVYWHNYKHQMM